MLPNEHGIQTANIIQCEELVAEEDWKKDSSLISKDDDGYLWVIGQCTCGGAVVELAEEIAGIVADALEQLDNLLCGILLQAFVSIAEIGVNFIPGGQVLGAFRLSVKAAKTFTENGLEAGGFMGNVSIAWMILSLFSLADSDCSGWAKPAVFPKSTLIHSRFSIP